MKISRKRNPILAVSGIFLSMTLFVGCLDRERNSDEKDSGKSSVTDAALSDSEIRVVEGVLKHHPTDVKSVQAWLGHEFQIGETPIRATEAVSAETLKSLVGKTVRVEGEWNPGEKWSPAEGEQVISHPLLPEGGEATRGQGIEASSVSELR